MTARFLAVLVLAIGFVQSTPRAAAQFFQDTESSWYRDDIDDLTRRGTLRGYPDGTFGPTRPVNRAEFLKAAFPDVPTHDTARRRCFPDVSPNAWYAASVCAAKDRGLVEGRRGGSFQPEETVNQAEALKMLLLARGERIQEVGASPWYKPYLLRAEELGIASRASAMPWQPLTRERMASILVRSLRQTETGRPGNLSTGCFQPAPESPPSVLDVRGAARSFILAVPEGYSPRQAHPLIVAFHGRTNSNERVRGYMRLEQTGLDALVAYPAGQSRSDGTYLWSPTTDLLFFDVLVKDIGARYCLDLDRVFATGHSLGAWFANTVGCAFGDVVRGTAAVAGQPGTGACKSPAAGIFFHDPLDQLVRIADGEHSRDQRIRQNACDAHVTPPTGSLNCVEHLGCVEGEPVVWCKHDQGGVNGHQWPNTTGRIIADFFRSLP